MRTKSSHEQTYVYFHNLRPRFTFRPGERLALRLEGLLVNACGYLSH
jgi:hypothetical protein